MRVEIVLAAAEQEPVLANLLELYVKDFSEFLRVEVGPDGRFVYDKLPLYWAEPDRYPFLAMVDGETAGFVFVKRGSELSDDPNCWDVAEFSVLPAFRRRGVGSEIARQVWSRFPGRWEVRVMEENRFAAKFWNAAITKFTGKPVCSSRVEKGGRIWHLFSFVAA